MVIDPEAFGRNLKSLLKERGMSQRALAETLKMGTMTVWKWCNGQWLPSLDNFAILCKTLNVSADDLLKGVVK